MNRQEAENIITEYLKPIFGFALKRCKSIEDAEDLSQEIIYKAFRALLNRDDIIDASKFIWTIAHNTLNNYYRASAKSMVGVSLDEVAELIADPNAVTDSSDSGDALRCLQGEIAYLSKLQRKIVISYYFEHGKQADIAKQLGVSLGTVKWHLFEAKKELKRGIDTMRKNSELKFHPIQFRFLGLNGSKGTKSLEEFFHSSLSQNICYAVRNTAKTVNEIADDLGVSPVYVETEAEYLEEYGFLKMQKGKYILNFIISEPTQELLVLQDTMYKRAAELFANDLYDELTASAILDDPDIVCHQTDEPLTLTSAPKVDKNFLLWTLIPYIAACSGENLTRHSIDFEEVATIRPDGSHNIVHASVFPEKMTLPKDYVAMNDWCGPMWSGNQDEIFWQINSQWSNRSASGGNISFEAEKVISARHFEEDRSLSKFDYAWLTERGYIKTCGDPATVFRSSWQIVILESKEIKDKLLAVGERIKKKHQAEFEAIKAPYAKAILDTVPAHLRKIKEYELQFVFHSNGWFLLHCLVCLLKNGKLKEPTEGQRKALMTLIAKIK